MENSKSTIQNKTTENNHSFSGNNATRTMPAVSVIQKAEHEALPVQTKPNNTGLPDNLKTGIENLSGYSMDDIKVHYNSPKPAQLQALAYAQGTDIHVAPGQEQHLQHEAWHVVQQKQGRVHPTMQMKEGIAMNDDKGLENEADALGTKASQTSYSSCPNTKKTNYAISKEVIQRAVPSVGNTIPKPIPNTGNYRARGGQRQIFSVADFPREVFNFGTNTRQEVLRRPEFNPQPPIGRVATITDITGQRVNVEGVQLDHRQSWHSIATAMEAHNKDLRQHKINDIDQYYTYYDAKMYYNDIDNLYPVLGAINAAAGAAGVGVAQPIPDALRQVLDVLSDSTNHLRASLIAKFANGQDVPQGLPETLLQLADQASVLAENIFENE
ncbi:MAG: DUF4157 domain-containing protein [Bacteroidota bacterium]|nr:DUF4157 domain-containing protein [Bacteroidota bacterium]